MKSYKSSNYKPLYMAGFMVMAFGLTSFNPTNAQKHMASSESIESRELSSEKIEPIFTKLNETDFEYYLQDDANNPSNQFVVYRKNNNTHACATCATPIPETYTINLNKNEIKNLELLSHAIIGDFNKRAQTPPANPIPPRPESVADEDSSEESSCSEFDYRDGKSCFKEKFKLANDCRRRSYEKQHTNECDNVDLDSLKEDFKEWASYLATEEDLSVVRLNSLKKITRDSDVTKHLSQLIQFKTKYEEWEKYNSTFQREMFSLSDQILDLNSQIQSSTNEVQKQQLIIKRKQLITDAEAGAQKYQRFYAAAFPSATTQSISGADTLLSNLNSSYEETLTPFSDVISKQSLLSLNSSPASLSIPDSTPAASAEQSSVVDTSSLTSNRQSRGYISGYDYSSLLSQFSSQNNEKSMYSSQTPFVSSTNSTQWGARPQMSGNRGYTGQFSTFRPQSPSYY